MLHGVFSGLHALPKQSPRPKANLAPGSSNQSLPQTGNALPAKKKQKKKKKSGDASAPLVSGAVSAAWQHAAASVISATLQLKKSAVAAKVEDLLWKGSLDEAVECFLSDTALAHPAQPKLLEALLKNCRLSLATKVVREAKQKGELPQHCVIACLLQLPQSASMDEGREFVEAVDAAALWPSPKHEDYFRRITRPLVLEFLDEASSIIRQLQGGGRKALLNLTKSGTQSGEIIFTDSRGGPYPSARNASDRGLEVSDSVVLRPMGAVVMGAVIDSSGICECEVAEFQPGCLKLRPMNPEHYILSSKGPFRVDAIASRIGYTRMVRSVHIISEPLRKKASDVRVMRRLLAKHQPTQSLCSVLVGNEQSCNISKKVRLVQDACAGLNKSQCEALTAATSKNVSLVQGPPGTGKTKTCVRILLQWVHSWKKQSNKCCLLATSDSNIAVDNLVEGLTAAGLKAVRLGRPEVLRPEILEHTVDELAAKSLGVSSLRDIHDRDQKKRAMQKVMEEAQVVCCTAIGAGASFVNDFFFPYVLVDEAAQATEPATLVPLCRGSEKIVLVGDHCQLPPTVCSDAASKAGMTLSLFERLASEGLQPTMLEVQYRMHPCISAFPRMHFYDNRLSDGVGAEDRVALEGFDWPDPGCPVCLMPVPGNEHSDGMSFQNANEARTVVEIALGFIAAGLAYENLGVVTPYASQARLIRMDLSKKGIPTGQQKGGIEVSSVDGYQGREKDIMLMSTVRASQSRGIGFVSDWRRVNVAFTRARRGFVVVCHPETLARESLTWLPWLHWIKDNSFHHDKLPELPPLQPSSQMVGLATLEQSQTKTRERSRSRSPPPQWKVRAIEAEKMRVDAIDNARQALMAQMARMASAGASPLAAPSAMDPMMPQVRSKNANVQGKGNRYEDDDDDDDDDRGDSLVGSDRKHQVRDVGVGNVNHEFLGMQQQVATASISAAVRKESPSPFLSGSGVNMSSAASELGIRSLKTTLPKKKMKKKPKKPKKPCASEQSGGLLLGAYDSSDSAASSDVEESSDSDGEVPNPGESDMQGQKIVASSMAPDSGSSSEASDSSEHDADDCDALDEFL